jgi:hypothetical protein
MSYVKSVVLAAKESSWLMLGYATEGNSSVLSSTAMQEIWGLAHAASATAYVTYKHQPMKGKPSLYGVALLKSVNISFCAKTSLMKASATAVLLLLLHGGQGCSLM